MTPRHVVLALAIAAQSAGAQVGSIAGVVRMGGMPVLDARVQLDSVREARSDSLGRFRFDSVATGRHRVRALALGATPVVHDVGVIADYTSRLEITLEKVTILDSVLVEGSTVRQGFVRAFEERKRLGVGKFLDSTDVRRYAEVRQAVLMLPGVKMNTAGLLLFGSFPGCAPNIWIDNNNVGTEQGELKTLSTYKIVAVEVYTRSALLPEEFKGLRGRSDGCGALIVWTTRLWPQGKKP